MSKCRQGCLVAFDANDRTMLERMDDGLGVAGDEVVKMLKFDVDPDEREAIKDEPLPKD